MLLGIIERSRWPSVYGVIVLKLFSAAQHNEESHSPCVYRMKVLKVLSAAADNGEV